MSIRFVIIRVGTTSNTVVWEGTADDDTAPLAFVDDMREYGPQMAVGDLLTLNGWFHAERIA